MTIRLDPAEAERRFARRVRLALDDSAARLPGATLERLAAARKAALRVHHREPVHAPATRPALAGLGGFSTRMGFGRAGLVASAMILVGVCLAGLYQVEQQKRIEDLADMDTAVLSDDVPIGDYADHGFNAYLKQAE